LGASARDIEKKKTSMIESAQTTLGGMKKNPKDQKF
jgi:hypothetical protein